MSKPETTPCRWEPTDEGNYETECGQSYTIIDGTPTENGMKFCCYCGKTIKDLCPKQ